MENLTIGQIAESANVNASTIRYYESIGLLPEAKRVNGQRRYSEEILKQIKFIKTGQHIGFTVQEIGALLKGFTEKSPQSLSWRSIAEKKSTELKQKHMQIEMMIGILENGLKCQCLTWDDCFVYLENLDRRLDN